jgi:hypothetical protein
LKQTRNQKKAASPPAQETHCLLHKKVFQGCGLVGADGFAAQPSFEWQAWREVVAAA